MDMEKGKYYYPHRDGFIKAMRIFENGHDGTVLANLFFTNGNDIVVCWDDYEERDMFICGITSDTLVYDDRNKPEFESFLEGKKNKDYLNDPYIIHLISNYSKFNLAVLLRGTSDAIVKYYSGLISELKNKFSICVENKEDWMFAESNTAEMIAVLRELEKPLPIGKINDYIRTCFWQDHSSDDEKRDIF